MGQPFPNQVVGGNGTLLIPAIQSPNFSTAAKTGWQIQQNGDATFFQLTIQGGSIIVDAATGGVFIYDTVPGPGSPPVNYAVSDGTTTDPFGNPLPATGGFVSVGATSWVQADDGQFNFERGSYISEDISGSLTLGGGAGVNTLQSLLPVSGFWVSVRPGTPAAQETWHTVNTGFPAGWSGTFAYTLLPFDAVQVKWALNIIGGTSVTDGETILAAGSLPSGYQPATTGFLAGLSHISGADSAACIQVTSTGAVSYNGPASSAVTLLAGTGIYPLGV